MTMPTSAKPSHETSEKAKPSQVTSPWMQYVSNQMLLVDGELCCQHCLHSASLKTYFSLRIDAVSGATERTRKTHRHLVVWHVNCCVFNMFLNKQCTFQVLSINTVSGRGFSCNWGLVTTCPLASLHHCTLVHSTCE